MNKKSEEEIGEICCKLIDNNIHSKTKNPDQYTHIDYKGRHFLMCEKSYYIISEYGTSTK